MNIPDRLPNPPKYRDFPELTKEEWEDYYACREKYDIAMTEEEKWEIRDKACDLFEKGFDGAHDAFADITATRNCFLELVKREIITIGSL